jgi:hypothetical protein
MSSVIFWKLVRTAFASEETGRVLAARGRSCDGRNTRDAGSASRSLAIPRRGRRNRSIHAASAAWVERNFRNATAWSEESMNLAHISRTTFAFGALCLTLAACGPDPNPNGETHVGSIVGTIIDASNGQAVPSASVVVGTHVRNVVASDGGKFTLEGVPIGNQTLVIRAIGYATETETILVTTGNTSKAGDAGLVRLQSTLTPPASSPQPRPT